MLAAWLAATATGMLVQAISLVPRPVPSEVLQTAYGTTAAALGVLGMASPQEQLRSAATGVALAGATLAGAGIVRLLARTPVPPR